jgi:hypothetical protein
MDESIEKIGGERGNEGEDGGMRRLLYNLWKGKFD